MNKQKLVIAWIKIRKEELMADWNLAVNGQKIFTIKVWNDDGQHTRYFPEA